MKDQIDEAGRLFHAGLELMAKSDRAGAENAFRRVLQLQPGLAAAHSNLGLLLEGAGRPEAAEACYRRALELNPGLVQTGINFGALLAARQRYAEAEAIYRRALGLAPEHPEPAAHDDAFGVYQWALRQGYAADRLGLSGDSAGGNLALATVLRARDAGLPLPGALALFSPWLDFAEEGASHPSVSDDPVLAPPLIEGFRQAYLGNLDRKSPAVTPFYADFHGLPPTLVQVGSWERLRDDSITLVERMKAADVSTELKIFDGMCHGWQLFASMLEEGMASIEQAAHFIRARQVSQ